jgi:hypothetical protein
MHHITLALVLAGLGEKDAAIAEGKLAVALLPESQDALDGPKMTLALAQFTLGRAKTTQLLSFLNAR